MQFKLGIFIKKYSFYVIAVLVFLSMLYFASHMSEKWSKLLLTPYIEIIELFYNNQHQYVNGVGYIEENNAYIIGKECLGLNFTSILFAMTSISFMKYFMGFKKLLWLFFCFFMSITVGFFVNSIRLLSSIPFVFIEQFVFFHALLGIGLYLFFLIFIHWLLKTYFERKEV